MALKKQWMNIKGKIVLAILKEEIKVAYTESEMKTLCCQLKTETTKYYL